MQQAVSATDPQSSAQSGTRLKPDSYAARKGTLFDHASVDRLADSLFAFGVEEVNARIVKFQCNCVAFL